MHCFIPITQAFKDANEGASKGCNTLKTATTLTGQHVVSINAVNEFPELFIERLRFTALWLNNEDFPTETTLF